MKTKKYRNKDWLHQKYVIEYRSMEEIAHLCGLKSLVTIYNWLQKLGIQSRGNSYPDNHHHGWNGGTTGYWSRKAHVVWEKYWREEVPEGYIIHHVDKNIANNEISNLALVTRSYHAKTHDVPLGGKSRCVQVN